MKDQILLPEAGYYKANLHCHTTLSDGEFTPEQIKAAYQEQGYSIVAFTDHRRYENHTQLNDEGFLALAALEVDLTEEPAPGRDWPVRKCYHLNLLDTDPSVHAAEKQASSLPACAYGDLEGLNRYIQEMNGWVFWCVTTTPTGPSRTGGITAA